MTRIFISTEPTPHEQPVGLHIIDGARQCSFSAPKLTAAGFRLWLTDTGESLLILPVPSTQAVVLHRQHSTPTTFGHGLWHIDFTATTGQLQTQSNVVALSMLPTMLSPTPHICQPATKHAPLLSLSLPDSSPQYQHPSSTPPQNLQTLHEHRWHGRNYSRGHVDTPTYLAYIGSLTPDAIPLDAPPSLPTTHNRRGRRPRFRSINGLPLHAALGHPPNKKVPIRKRMVAGFPAKLSSFPNHRCHGCRAGAMMNQPVPDGSTTLVPAAPFEPTTANGQVWYFDNSRTMQRPGLHGNTAFVLFVEKNTLFVVVALIKSHSDVWEHAQALVDWTWTHLGIRVSHLCGDSDPEWTNSQPHSRHTKTARAMAFETKNGLTLLVSPPYAHAFSLAEGRMKPITAIMAIQLQYAYLSDIL